MKSTEILNSLQVSLTIKRLCHQLIENHHNFSKSVLIGLQPNGIFLANRLKSNLEISIQDEVQTGSLDITFFRDDFRRFDKTLSASSSQMEVTIEGKSVVLIDDVLFTGRSIRAALTSLDNYGRPLDIQLLVLIDRRFSRHLPIQPDFVGAQVDAFEGDRVRVHWKDNKQDDIVYIEKNS